MSFEVKVLADSIASSGKRLTTVMARYPRFIHSEEMTHRVFSRNSASSRAIPALKLIDAVAMDPVIPIWWGKNEPGMQARAEVDDKEAAKAWWLEGQKMMVEHARRGVELGLHKQIVNRVIEPWMWITIIKSGTTWTNFFGLRRHEDAEPHMQRSANLGYAALDASTPKQLGVGEWHMPLIQGEDFEAAAKLVKDGLDLPPLPVPGPPDFIRDLLIRVSVGRCARVSYLTHDGRRDLLEDVKLHDKLVASEPLHASPAEHVAMSLAEPKRIGNFVGWHQYRKMLKNEHIGEPMP